MLFLKIIGQFIVEVLFVEILGGILQKINNAILKLSGIVTGGIEEDKMIGLFKRAIESESVKELQDWLANEFCAKGGNSMELYPFIEKALFAKWHTEHEDLVNMIYLYNYKDDRFVEPILNIARNRKVFRKYDDELESTLRKCVHALKAIDSKNSNEAVDKLIGLNNENVKFVLKMYS